MFNKIFLIIVLALLVILQFGFISALPQPWSHFNVIIVVLVLGLFLWTFNTVLLFIISIGIILDIMSWTFFGFYTIGFSFTAIATFIFLTNYFADKSVYSFIVISILATVVYEIYRVIFMSSLEFSFMFLKILLHELWLNTLFVVLAFYVINQFSNALYSVILKRS